MQLNVQGVERKMLSGLLKIFPEENIKTLTLERQVKIQ